MQIRARQCNSLQQQTQQDFEKRAMSHFRQDLAEPAARFGDEELRALLWRAAVSSYRYGLTTEREIVAFADTAILVGPGFEMDPTRAWAQQVLNKRGWSAEQRARRLVETAGVDYKRRKELGSA